MKKLRKYLLLIISISILFSCNRNVNEKNIRIDELNNYNEIEKKENTVVNDVIENNNFSSAISLSLLIGENHDLLTDYYWSLSDGRYLEDRSAPTYDWVGKMTPRVVFKKLEIPFECIIYQVQLRSDLFYYLYQTDEEKDKLYPIGSSFGTNIFDVTFGEDFSYITLNRGRVPWGRHYRVGQQENFEYPLVGIWGNLPSQEEYRLADSTDCQYYMEIDKEIPFWAVREGTYLLKQTDDKTFETVSSFPEGRLRIEIMSDRDMLLTPLFTLPDGEEGLTAPLVMNRNLTRISELDNDEDNPYNR